MELVNFESDLFHGQTLKNNRNQVLALVYWVTIQSQFTNWKIFQK